MDTQIEMSFTVRVVALIDEAGGAAVVSAVEIASIEPMQAALALVVPAGTVQ